MTTLLFSQNHIQKVCESVCNQEVYRNESRSWISYQKKGSRQECEADMVGTSHLHRSSDR
jgi:hypothetical protein